MEKSFIAFIIVYLHNTLNFVHNQTINYGKKFHSFHRRKYQEKLGS